LIAAKPIIAKFDEDEDYSLRDEGANEETLGAEGYQKVKGNIKMVVFPLPMKMRMKKTCSCCKKKSSVSVIQ